MSLGKKRLLKTVVFTVKWEILVQAKPGKGKHPKVARLGYRVGGSLHLLEKPRWIVSDIASFS